MSSHILSEVEKTCDRVAIIRDGQLARVDRVEALRDMAHHQVELRFASAPPVAEFEALPGVSEVVATDHTITMRVSGPITPVVHAAARHEVIDFVVARAVPRGDLPRRVRPVEHAGRGGMTR